MEMNDECISNLEQQIRWIEEIDAHKFPGWGHAVGAMRQAIVLLKAQEPRVMSSEEMEQAWKNGEAVYVETPNDGCFWALVYPPFEPPKDKPFNYSGEVRFNVVKVNGYICDGDFYDKMWRCWTSRPTDEQREATPWQKPENS